MDRNTFKYDSVFYSVFSKTSDCNNDKHEAKFCIVFKGTLIDRKPSFSFKIKVDTEKREDKKWTFVILLTTQKKKKVGDVKQDI